MVVTLHTPPTCTYWGVGDVGDFDPPPHAPVKMAHTTKAILFSRLIDRSLLLFVTILFSGWGVERESQGARYAGIRGPF